MISICHVQQREAYMIASGIICAIYVLCAVVLFFGVRERKGTYSQWLSPHANHVFTCSVSLTFTPSSPSRPWTNKE